MPTGFAEGRSANAEIARVSDVTEVLDAAAVDSRAGQA